MGVHFRRHGVRTGQLWRQGVHIHERVGGTFTEAQMLASIQAVHTNRGVGAGARAQMDSAH